MGRRKSHTEIQGFFPAGGESDGHYFPLMGRKTLPGEGYSSRPVGDGVNGPFQVESPGIIREFIMPGEMEFEVAKRLVGLLDQGHAHELLHGQLFRLLLPALEQQLPYSVEIAVGAQVGIIVGFARPERLFVELDTLLFGAPEDHRPQPAVPHGQGFGPLLSRPVVP